MNSIRHFIVAGSLLGASLVPHFAHAMTTPHSFAANDSPVARRGTPLSSGLLALGGATEASKSIGAGAQAEDASLAQREQAAPELRDFRGGRVYVYLGGGVTLLLVLLLVLILL